MNRLHFNIFIIVADAFLPHSKKHPLFFINKLTFKKFLRFLIKPKETATNSEVCRKKKLWQKDRKKQKKSKRGIESQMNEGKFSPIHAVLG